MSTPDPRTSRWKAFRETWPARDLPALTLERYTQPDHKAGLSGWVKFKTDGLGWRPKRGTSWSRIGVCALIADPGWRDLRIKAHQELKKNSSVDAEKGYVWSNHAGHDVESAFEFTKQRILEIAEAAQRGDTSVLKTPRLHADYEWKLFFLYQDEDQPVLLPAQEQADVRGWYADRFKEWLPAGGAKAAAAAVLANQRLMEERNGRPLFEYVDQIAGQPYRDEESDLSDSPAGDAPSTPRLASEPALNQILYGPPGTGKTYATIEAALAVLDPDFLQQHRTEDQRAALKSRFDVLLRERRVRFVTFHQSFSYEDFVEGLRADSQDGQLRYRVEAGIFSQLCVDAQTAPGERSLSDTLDDWLDAVAEQNVQLRTATGKPFTVSYTPGNDTLACLPESTATGKPLPANIEMVRAVLLGQEPERMYCKSYVRGIAEHVRQLQHPKPAESVGGGARHSVPYVLIIDEINRGNISRIFGELITLIEPSKRAGASEALEVVLPYSKKPFSVPQNVYLIGTMNSADRSLTGMDVALRRRFVFKAMPPRADLLEGVDVEGISIGRLLSVLNERIEALLDRDHCLGHAYFMPLRQTATLDKLAEIFSNQVLPLLQEYFFDDWQRIQWVLNDHRKPEAFQFVSAKAVDVDDLFGANVNVAHSSQAWSVNDDAFWYAESYLGVIDHREAQDDE